MRVDSGKERSAVCQPNAKVQLPGGGHAGVLISINQSTNQPINQSTNQPINQSTNQPINQSIVNGNAPSVPKQRDNKETLANRFRHDPGKVERSTVNVGSSYLVESPNGNLDGNLAGNK
jgi:hypothetical protein